MLVQNPGHQINHAQNRYDDKNKKKKFCKY